MNFSARYNISETIQEHWKTGSDANAFRTIYLFFMRYTARRYACLLWYGPSVYVCVYVYSKYKDGEILDSNPVNSTKT